MNFPSYIPGYSADGDVINISNPDEYHHHHKRRRIGILLLLRKRHQHKYQRRILRPLFPNQRTTLMLNVTVGHEVDCSIVYLDQNGNPMQAPVSPDAAPTWSNQPSAAGVDSLTPSADGTAAVVQALAAGTDSVTVDLKVGGVDFSAVLQLSVQPAPQVLTSVAISAAVK